MTNEISVTTPIDPTPALPEFKLDAQKIEVEVDASATPGVQKLISARMTKPTADDLVKREAMTLTEIVEASATEDSIVVEEERGNAWLFDKIATHVQGFRFKTEPKEAAADWREVTPELLALIPSSYKSAFVRGMYQVSAKLVETEDEGVILGGDDIISVDFFVGDEENPQAVIRFELPEPSESERRKYQSKAVELRQPRGARKTRNRIVANLGAAIKFFDELMLKSGAAVYSPSGTFEVTVGGSNFESRSNPLSKTAFLDGIDPHYKRLIVSAAMGRYNAKVSD